MKYTIIHTYQFAEWIGERYNFLGGDLCCWVAKQNSPANTVNHRTTGELFEYWLINICTQ